MAKDAVMTDLALLIRDCDHCQQRHRSSLKAKKARIGHEEKPLPAMPKGCFVFGKATFAFRLANDGEAPKPGGRSSY
jgi:hypothetical protein